MFLSIIEGNVDRLAVIEAILDEYHRGQVEIFTSTLSITEVAFAKFEKEGKALDPAVEASIDKLWLPNSPFTLFEVHDGITRAARDLMRKSLAELGKCPKPADAIHLVTAERCAANAFHTYDGPLLKYDPILPFRVEEPRSDGFVWTD